jgi:addiction module RelE/StbE family toxin
MYNLHWDEPFIRKAKKLMKNNPNFEIIFKKRIELLELDPFHPTLKTHKLQGKLKKYYSCSIDYYFRLIFDFLDNENIQLLDIGSHDEVY